MSNVTPLWVTLVGPVATLLGTMLVVMLGVYLQNRAVERVADSIRAELGQLRAEFRQQLAELELRLTKQLLELTHRVERLEETRGLIRT